MYQLTKQIFGWRGNPSKEELYDVLGIKRSEEMVKSMILKNLHVPKSPTTTPIFEKLQSPVIINFVLRRTIKDLKWKGKKWSWNIIADQSHLIDLWPDLVIWRNKLHMYTGVSSLKKLTALICGKESTRDQPTLETLENVISEFESVARKNN